MYGRFAVPEAMAQMLRTAPDAGRHGPVLLVDDLVDSRWSLAEAARVLREAGAQGAAARPRPGRMSRRGQRSARTIASTASRSASMVAAVRASPL